MRDVKSLENFEDIAHEDENHLDQDQPNNGPFEAAGVLVVELVGEHFE